MAFNKTDKSPPQGGILLQLNLVGLIIFSGALVIASTLVTYGLVQGRSPGTGRTAGGLHAATVTAAGDAVVEQKNPRPWGQLNVRGIDLEQPEEYVAYETSTNQPETWTFDGMTVDAVRSLMQSCGVAADQIERALSSAHPSVNGRPVVVTPDDELVFSLSPSTRANLYGALARYGAYDFWQYPFCYPGKTFDTWFERGRLPAPTLSLLRQLMYPRGDALCFSDLRILLRRLPDEASRLQLVKALSHQSALLLGIRVWPDTDIDKLIGYWAWPANVRLIDARPLLEALKRNPAGGSISIIYFLPPFARQRLYTYPLPNQPNDPAMDCHWTTMNFFSETPDNRFSDPAYTAAYVSTNYYPIGKPTAYGDVIFLLNKDGNAIHSAVYLADDIVFTKNGNNFSQPWMLMHLKDLRAEFTTDAAPGMAVYRNKKW